MSKDFCDQVLICKRKLKIAPVCEVCLDSAIRNKRKPKVSFHLFPSHNEKYGGRQTRVDINAQRGHQKSFLHFPIHKYFI